MPRSHREPVIDVGRGTALPPFRNTVLVALAGLTAEDWIETVPRRGSFVTHPSSALSPLLTKRF
jgi:hypothetical protein